MVLLFDKNDDGADEIADVLGFLDYGSSFRKFKPFVRSATKAIVKLVGEAIYQRAVTAYQSDQPTMADEELYLHFQTPIALLAYSQMAPNNDLSHTQNGRKMQVDANQKAAWEWMIDRDDEQTERRYYNAVDELLDFISELTEWKLSEQYAEMHSTFVHDTDVFKKYYPDGNRLLMLRLTQGFRKTIDEDIASRLREEDMTQVVGASFIEPTTNEIKALVAKAQEACVYGGLIWGLKRLRVTMFPEGLLQAYTGDRSTTKARAIPVGSGIQAVTQQFEADLKLALDQLETMSRQLDPDYTVPAQITIERPASRDDKYLSL